VLLTAAIALVCVIAGYQLLPGFIRLMGKSGRVESVEWAVYMLLGSAFPVAAGFISWRATHAVSSRARAWTMLAAGLVVAAAAWFSVVLGLAAFCIGVGFAALVLAIEWRVSSQDFKDVPVWSALVFVILAATWEATLRLGSWTDAGGWFTQSIRTPVLALFVIAAVTATFASRDGNPAGEFPLRFKFSWIDLPAVALFLMLSFRTTPIVEFYHWSFWVGPMESVRQGGWLLWDVPSQYGFLSVLLPALLPTSDAWQALYFFQAALYAVAAFAIYATMATVRPGLVARLVAIFFTATAFFFRPRTLSLILPAQMTPAGGPMRFIWCYAMLGVLVWKHARGEAVTAVRFAVVGTLVWIASLAWSAESAIYTTVAWGGAYGVFLLQKFFSARRASDDAPRRRLSGLAAGVALPFAALAGAMLLLSLGYRALNGHPPDWMSYYEYALLFSGGYSGLPVETTGVVWYLVLLFMVLSAALVRLFVRNPHDSRLVIGTGAWGTVWGISSYFVSRSHPVNLLSLVPLLVISLVIVLIVLRSAVTDRWTRLLTVVTIPLVSMPILLTLTHSGFPALLLQPQSPVAALSAQVPPMDSSLAQLAMTAGMRADDAVFFVSDGRYVMPRWPELRSGLAETNSRGWMPKPYEMISTLPAARRNAYMERFGSRFEMGGWLIQKKSDINEGYLSAIDFIEKGYARARTFENENWLMIRYEPLVSTDQRSR